MNIIVTGCDGYIGCMVVQTLLEEGHHVVGIDTGYYRVAWLYNGITHSPEVISKDIRDIQVSDLQGFDAVVHLAELSNDPLGQNNPEVTFKINHQGSVRLAKIAKEAGVKRFVYTSSCSAYGIGGDDAVTEESPVNPQTAYAECKVLVEKDVSALADESFTPVFLRNATVYGASPRIRFDVVLNNLCGLAKTTGKISMISDGSPWRPLVHVLDVCQAISCCLAAPTEVIYKQIFNVGSNEENYRVKEIAEIVAEAFPGCELSFGDQGGADNRSYRVNFDKIATKLPGFKTKYTARDGAKQLAEIFNQIDLDSTMFEHRGFTRLKQLEYLIRTQQLDADFFWRKP